MKFYLQEQMGWIWHLGDVFPADGCDKTNGLPKYL
jgi:hypothetical protein